MLLFRSGFVCVSCGLVRRESEFGLWRDLEKRRKILGALSGGMLGSSPQTPGIDRFWPSPPSGRSPGPLVGVAIMEARVAAEGRHRAGPELSIVRFGLPVDSSHREPSLHGLFVARKGAKPQRKDTTFKVPAFPASASRQPFLPEIPCDWGSPLSRLRLDIQIELQGQ